VRRSCWRRSWSQAAAGDRFERRPASWKSALDDRALFPEDVVFQETADRGTFQGRYVLRHPWTGDASCEAAGTYRQGLAERREGEAKRLADLAGWTLPEIRKKMGLAPGGQVQPAAWWERIWG
jgi:hypothetical protein